MQVFKTIYFLYIRTYIRNYLWLQNSLFAHTVIKTFVDLFNK